MLFRSGYWSEILAPYAKATGGNYIVAMGKPDQKLPAKFADKAVYGDEWTRWGAASGSLSGWLAVDLGKDEQVGRVQIIEQSCPRTKEFTVEYRVGDTWKELARGTTIGENKMINFPPVTARHVRLNILKANEVPSIDEFRVLRPAGGVTQ